VIDLNKDFWTDRYDRGQTGWDIGHVSTPIKEYIDQLEDQDLKILIPGAGNAYEAEYLWAQGFRNVDVLDISLPPIEALKQRVPEWPEDQLLQIDFFEHQGRYDLIIEQTFFCALDPNLRSAYLEKMKALLKPSGKLVGLLFNVALNSDQPPFGGHESQYRPLFETFFQLNIMEEARNSVPPRAGNELWFSASLL
jgi:SAM-dependent methyltransferase